MLVFKIRIVPKRIDNVPFKKCFLIILLTRTVNQNHKLIKRCRDSHPIINIRDDLYVYKSLKDLAQSIVLLEKNLMKCKKKMLKIEMNVLGRHPILVTQWFIFWKSNSSVEPGKHCTHCKVVYLDL